MIVTLVNQNYEKILQAKITNKVGIGMSFTIDIFIIK